MKNPGSKRKQLQIEDELTDPKVIQKQFKTRKKFMKNGGLENYVKNELRINL